MREKSNREKLIEHTGRGRGAGSRRGRDGDHHFDCKI